MGIDDYRFIKEKWEELGRMEKEADTPIKLMAFLRRLDQFMGYANSVVPDGMSLKEYLEAGKHQEVSGAD